MKNTSSINRAINKKLDLWAVEHIFFGLTLINEIDCSAFPSNKLSVACGGNWQLENSPTSSSYERNSIKIYLSKLVNHNSFVRIKCGYAPKYIWRKRKRSQPLRFLLCMNLVGQEIWMYVIARPVLLCIKVVIKFQMEWRTAIVCIVASKMWCW